MKMAAICGNVRKFAGKNVNDATMRSIFHALWATLVMVSVLSSCLNSDDSTVTLYDDMAITAFSLGTLNRYPHTTSESGSDSIYKVAYSAAGYVMSIDQLGGRIFNSVALPSYTDLKHVVCSLSTKNSGLAVLKSLTSDSLTTFSSTDSIDFSVPRELRVYATSGAGYRAYTVTLTVNELDNSALSWTEVPVSDYPAGSGGIQYKTEGGALLSSADNGQSWQEETLGDDGGLLPTEVLSCVSWTIGANATYSLLAGHRADDETTTTLWRKVDYDGQPAKWVYMTVTDNNPYYLPYLQHVVLLYYNDQVLAVGSDGKLYRTEDQGITWQVTSDYALPDAFVEDTPAAFDATVADGCLWLLDSEAGKAWRTGESGE